MNATKTTLVPTPEWEWEPEWACPCESCDGWLTAQSWWWRAEWCWTLVTDFEKLARLCTTLAMSVSVREVRSDGYSCVMLNSDGDMMAGHRNRRKREELMRRSAMSSRPRSAQRTRHEANTSFSSRGNTLQRERQREAEREIFTIRGAFPEIIASQL